MYSSVNVLQRTRLKQFFFFFFFLLLFWENFAAGFCSLFHTSYTLVLLCVYDDIIMGFGVIIRWTDGHTHETEMATNIRCMSFVSLEQQTHHWRWLFWNGCGWECKMKWNSVWQKRKLLHFLMEL